MSTQYPSRPLRLTSLLATTLIALISIANAGKIIEHPTSAQTRGLKDECVALSNAMALDKLGISVTGRKLTQQRMTKGLGREFEAAYETFPHEVADKVMSQVLLNSSSQVTSEVLRDLTRHGALVLSLSTKRLLGDRSGTATPDHAVHIREIVRMGGVDYMVVENCWGRGWGRGGIGHVPLSRLRELPYVYGLFLQKHDAAAVSSRTSRVINARPFRIFYASGRSYPQPRSSTMPSRANNTKKREINRFMDKLLVSK